MNLGIKPLNCFRRPLKRDDRILLWGTVAVMTLMVWYTGVLWYALLGVSSKESVAQNRSRVLSG